MTEENSYIVRGKPNSSLLIMAVFLTLVSLIFIYDLAVADGTYFRGHDLVVRQGVMMTMGAVLALVLGHINYHQVVEHVIILLYIICFFAMVCKIWPSVGGSFWNDSYIRLGDISFNISDLLQFEACVSFAGVAAIPRQKRGVLRDMSSVLMAAVSVMFISMALALEEIPGAILILLIALLLCFIRKPTVAGRLLSPAMACQKVSSNAYLPGELPLISGMISAMKPYSLCMPPLPAVLSGRA